MSNILFRACQLLRPPHLSPPNTAIGVLGSPNHHSYGMRIEGTPIAIHKGGPQFGFCQVSTAILVHLAKQSPQSFSIVPIPRWCRCGRWSLDRWSIMVHRRPLTVVCLRRRAPVPVVPGVLADLVVPGAGLACAAIVTAILVCAGWRSAFISARTSRVTLIGAQFLARRGWRRWFVVIGASRIRVSMRTSAGGLIRG